MYKEFSVNRKEVNKVREYIDICQPQTTAKQQQQVAPSSIM